MGTSFANDAYRAAIYRLLRFQPEVEVQLDELIKEEPTFPRAYLAKAYLGVLTSEPGPSRGSLALLAELDRTVPSVQLSHDELLHRQAVVHWAQGRFRSAQQALDRLLTDSPKDVLALFVGHQIDYFLGDKINLRDRIARSLPEWDEGDPERGFLLGMLAFGLEETRWYERAEQEGLAALDQDPADVWALHAVVHVHEMRGDARRGLRFMEERAEHWEDGNSFNVHNFWHKALYLLDLGAYDSVLDIYDCRLHNQASEGIALEMLDAASLLWRLYLQGRDEHERFSVLADAWKGWWSTRGLVDESARSTEAAASDRPSRQSFYVFNDCHSIMALVGAGRVDEARAILTALEHAAEASDDPTLTNVALIRQIGLPVSRAFVAFSEGDYAQVVDLLRPIRAQLAAFGGSDAQRDVIQRTLLEAALRDGQYSLARQLINERVTLSPGSNFNRSVRTQLGRYQAIAADSYAERGSEL